MPATVSSAISNFMWRRNAERVDTEEPDNNNNDDDDYDVELNNNNTSSDHNSITEDDENEEEGQFVGVTNNNSPHRTVDTVVLESVLPDDEEEEYPNTTATPTSTSALTTTSSATHLLTSAAGGRVSVIAPASSQVIVVGGEEGGEEEGSHPTGHQTTTLRDLEEERLVVQRRSGSCVLLSAFFLFQLWIQALTSGDFGLLLLCLVFTSWTARFVRYTRDREEQLTHRINNWNDTTAAANSNGGGGGPSSAVDDARRLRRMSFQSQLALAIIQSQIQLMEGGHGHPDAANNSSSAAGLSEDDKQNWDRFEFDSAASLMERGLFNDTAKDMSVVAGGEEYAAPECTICLCEYEKGDKLVSLPCKHVFHEGCITSWTDHNTRCPLCNTELGDSDNIV